MKRGEIAREMERRRRSRERNMSEIEINNLSIRQDVNKSIIYLYLQLLIQSPYTITHYGIGNKALRKRASKAP